MEILTKLERVDMNSEMNGSDECSQHSAHDMPFSCAEKSNKNIRFYPFYSLLIRLLFCNRFCTKILEDLSLVTNSSEMLVEPGREQTQLQKIHCKIE